MRILVGTERGLIEIDGGTRATIEPRATAALAPGPGGWWAVADESQILRSTDGRTFTETAGIRGLRANCVLGDDGGAIVGTSEAHLVRVADGSAERVRSFDRVGTRDEWYTPWGGPPDVRSLARDASGALYANVHVGGILRSDDGTSWKPTSMDVHADVHQVLAHPSEPSLVFAATAIGLATSSDAGGTWTFEEDGLHAAYCRAVAITGDTLLLSASRSHTGRQSALYRRPLEGGVFHRCERGLPEWFADNVDTYCLDARDGVAALGTTDGKIFVSTDSGATWDEAASGLPSISCLALS
jgi:hypothetical protein